MRKLTAQQAEAVVAAWRAGHQTEFANPAGPLLTAEYDESGVAMSGSAHTRAAHTRAVHTRAVHTRAAHTRLVSSRV
jgi:hypothetical protein